MPNTSPLNPYLESHGEFFVCLFLWLIDNRKKQLCFLHIFFVFYILCFLHILFFYIFFHHTITYGNGPLQHSTMSWARKIVGTWNSLWKRTSCRPYFVHFQKNKWPDVWIYIVNYTAASSGTQNKVGPKRSCKKCVIGHWKCAFRVRM